MYKKLIKVIQKCFAHFSSKCIRDIPYTAFCQLWTTNKLAE